MEKLYHIYITNHHGRTKYTACGLIPFSGIHSVRSHYAWLLKCSRMLGIASIEVVDA